MNDIRTYVARVGGELWAMDAVQVVVARRALHHGLNRAAATSNLLRNEPERDRGESKLVLREGVLGGVSGGDCTSRSILTRRLSVSTSDCSAATVLSVFVSLSLSIFSKVRFRADTRCVALLGVSWLSLSLRFVSRSSCFCFNTDFPSALWSSYIKE